MSSRRLQGRRVEPHHVQAVEQVLTEPAGLDRLRQVLGGGGHEAHVDVESPGPAEALEAPLFHDPQQLRLESEGQILNLVEVEGTPGGQLDLAHLGSRRGPP